VSRKPLEKCRILVTPTSFGRADPSLTTRLKAACGEVVINDTGRPLTAETLACMLQGVDGYIAGLDEISRATLAAADQLQVISRYGVGVDNVDLVAARERGIVVTNTPGANSVSVAELAVALILATIRRIPEAVAAMRAGEWPRLNGVTLRNKTVGIVGYGAIGRAVAERLRPFGCRLLAFDPYVQPGGSTDAAVTDLDELLRDSDIVTLHAPLTNETKRMANEGFFGTMKANSFLINTARGELIDEKALVEALTTGHLAGAAIDVFDREPLPKDSPLLGLPTLIATPHMAAHTDDAMNAMGEIAMKDCLSVLRGEKPEHPVE
jgi:D-3-phosphoglycerate dehydrogenase